MHIRTEILSNQLCGCSAWVATSLSTIRLADVQCESAKDFGLNVQGIFGVIDRLEGGREAIEQAGYRLATLLTIDDFREST